MNNNDKTKENQNTAYSNTECKTSSKSKYVDDMTTFLSWQNYCLTQYSWTMFQMANYQNMMNFQSAQYYNHLLSTQRQQTNANNNNNNNNNNSMNNNQQGNAGLPAQPRKGLNCVYITLHPLFLSPL